MKKTILSLGLILGVTVTGLSAAANTNAQLQEKKQKVDKLKQIIKKDFANPKTFKEFDDFYNKNFGITKPKKLDIVTKVVKSEAKGKTVIVKKEVSGTEKDLQKAYKEFLYPFGPEADAKNILNEIGEYLAYSAASKFCYLMMPSNYFANGGKGEFIVTNKYTNKVFDVKVDGKKSCKDVFDKISWLKFKIVKQMQKYQQEQKKRQKTSK